MHKTDDTSSAQGHSTGPGGVQHDHGVFLYGGHAGNQVVLAVGQAHMAAVRGGQLGAFGRTGKDDRGVRSFGGGGHGTQELRLVALVAVRGEALRYIGSCGHAGPQRRWHL